MEGELNNSLRLVAVTILSLLYCYYIASKIPKGFYRLLSILPVVALLFVIPFSIYGFCIGSSACFLLSNLCNLKLILFAFDQGPLSSPRDLLHFLLLAIFAFKIKQTQSKSVSKQLRNSVLEILIESTLLVILIHSYKYKHSFHQHVLITLYLFQTYLSVQLFLALVALPGQVILGVEVEPQSKAPFLFTSFQDFWGHRWNLRASDLLRATVYVPVRSLCTRVIGTRWASLPAVLVTFTISGLMHEVFYYHIIRERPTWVLTWFFIIHGIFIDIEIVFKKKLVATDKFGHLPRLLRFTGFFMASEWLFAQVVRNGVHEKIIGEFNAIVEFVKGKIP